MLANSMHADKVSLPGCRAGASPASKIVILSAFFVNSLICHSERSGVEPKNEGSLDLA